MQCILELYYLQKINAIILYYITHLNLPLICNLNCNSPKYFEVPTPNKMFPILIALKGSEIIWSSHIHIKIHSVCSQITETNQHHFLLTFWNSLHVVNAIYLGSSLSGTEPMRRLSCHGFPTHRQHSV